MPQARLASESPSHLPWRHNKQQNTTYECFTLMNEVVSFTYWFNTRLYLKYKALNWDVMFFRRINRISLSMCMQLCIYIYMFVCVYVRGCVRVEVSVHSWAQSATDGVQRTQLIASLCCFFSRSTGRWMKVWHSVPPWSRKYLQFEYLFYLNLWYLFQVFLCNDEKIHVEFK